jgi:hypothetical protein
MASADCNTCCSTLNYRNKTVTCPHCQFSCCVSGIKVFLCDIQLSPNPLCPNNDCKKPWSREFLMEKLTKTWYEKDYRDFRKQVLINKEKSFLPAAQIEAEARKETRKKAEEKLGLKNQIGETNRKIYMLRNESTNLKVKLEIAKSDDEAKEIKAKIKINKDEVANGIKLKRTLNTRIGELEEKTGGKVVERREFIQACPSENCKGFLSSRWRCGLCELWSCKECGCVKGPKEDSEHKCDVNIVANFQAIKKETTSCPGCSAKVFRVQGCDQMWCTQCHTSFDYKTGKIVTGRIHNPHFIEWQKNHGEQKREILDVQCGGAPGLYDLTKALEKIFEKRKIPLSFDKMYQRVLEVQENLVPAYAVHRNEHRNMDLRVKYLLNQITEEQWKSQLVKAEKEHEKREEICLVLQAYRDAGNDILRRMLVIKTANEYLNLFKEYQQLSKFIIEGLEKVLKLYNSSQTRISMLIRDLDRWIGVEDAKILELKKVAQPRNILPVVQDLFDGMDLPAQILNLPVVQNVLANLPPLPRFG